MLNKLKRQLRWKYYAIKYWLFNLRDECGVCRNDSDDVCEECCDHSDTDGGYCLICDTDQTENMCGAAESYYEGDR